MPRKLYQEMLAQARAELPNECCGLLAGRVRDAVGVVEKRYPLINELGSPREFFSEPKTMLAAMKDLREREIDILAIYHSHPTSEPVPSRKDIERNYYGSEVMALIISLQDEEPVMRGWWLREDGFSEAEWELM